MFLALYFLVFSKKYVCTHANFVFFASSLSFSAQRQPQQANVKFNQQVRNQPNGPMDGQAMQAAPAQEAPMQPGASTQLTPAALAAA